MRLVGFLETSLVDWDGKIASVLFSGGCNLHCPFCHNHRVADDDPGLSEVDWGKVQAALISKQNWVDGVVITGGEPMMHPEVFRLCSSVKELGFKVKMDTNGSFPYPLKCLIEAKLADFVAMDIKAPLNERYSAACGHKVDLAPIRRSIRLLVESGVECEFRATLVPDLINADNIEVIGAELKGATSVALQHYDSERARVKGFGATRNYSRQDAQSLADRLKPFVKEVKLRGKWDP
jgi:pyruvate formate lyase activating enzyme